jgi:hypothetical protein
MQCTDKCVFLCAGMSFRLAAGVKYFIYAREPSVFMSHKGMSLSTTFDSMFGILTNLAALGRDEAMHHPQMDRWIHRGLRLHQDWWAVWEESLNRWADRLSAGFDWPTPKHGGRDAAKWRLLQTSKVKCMAEERDVGADIKAAAAMMFTMNMQPTDKFLIPEGTAGNFRGRFTSYLRALVGPSAYSVATWSERRMWLQRAAQQQPIEVEPGTDMEEPPEAPVESTTEEEEGLDGGDDDQQPPPGPDASRIRKGRRMGPLPPLQVPEQGVPAGKVPGEVEAPAGPSPRAGARAEPPAGPLTPDVTSPFPPPTAGVPGAGDVPLVPQQQVPAEKVRGSQG